MAKPDPFAALTKSQADKIEQAVVDVLVADTPVKTFFGFVASPAVAARIERAPTPLLNPEVKLPYCWVTVPTITPQFTLQEETETRVTVQIRSCFEDLRDRVEPGDNTVKSLAAAIHIALWGNQLLVVTRFSNIALADELEELNATEFGELAPDGEDEEGSNIMYWMNLEAVYRVTLDLNTQLP